MLLRKYLVLDLGVEKRGHPSLRYIIQCTSYGYVLMQFLMPVNGDKCRILIVCIKLVWQFITM